MINSEFRKKMADSWFSYLQAQICKSFENLEDNKLKFSKRDWYKKNIKEGGGVSLKNVLNRGGGNFEFSSSNPMWRASLEILDFLSTVAKSSSKLFNKLILFIG